MAGEGVCRGICIINQEQPLFSKWKANVYQVKALHIYQKLAKNQSDKKDKT